MLEYAWRLLTDRKVTCRDCGRFIGYVALRGHRRWRCEACSPTARPEAL